MTTRKNNQVATIEDLLVDLTPEEAQNISGGVFGSLFRRVIRRFRRR